MNTQQHEHGERVFCWSQSMFGSGSKVWGTVRQCSKYKWVDLDNSVGSNQNRVRYDRAYWYSQDDWDLECQQIREMRENDKRKEEEEKIKAAERYQEVTANLVKLTEIKVGQKIRFVPKNCPDMHFVYIVTEIKNSVIFGLDSDNREVSVGRVGEVYFAVEEPIDNTVVKTVKEITPKNKVAKLQIKLTRLNAQLAITKGNLNKAKIVLSMLEIESSIEFLSSTIKNMQSFKDEVVTLPHPEWLQKLSIPELTKERVVNTINALDCKIEKLNNDINGITSQNHNSILNSNPAADTGGIRNQSDSKRQQFDDRLFRNAKNAVKASKERDTLITQKKRYIKDIKERPIFEKALKTGKKSSGESYDRETMQFIKDELKLINDRISKIEFSVTTQKFKKL